MYRFFEDKNGTYLPELKEIMRIHSLSMKDWNDPLCKLSNEARRIFSAGDELQAMLDADKLLFNAQKDQRYWEDKKLTQAGRALARYIQSQVNFLGPEVKTETRAYRYFQREQDEAKHSLPLK